MNKAFFAKKTGARGEIYIYEDIGEDWLGGGITAKAFSDSMKGLGNVTALDIYINSYGGSVFEGVAIYNQIKRFAGEKIVHIDGIAASISSIIAMAGDEIRIAANGTVMIHDPWGMSAGNAGEMRKTADMLDKIRDVLLSTYVARTGRSEKEISDWMSAETWMKADEAMKYGFATHKTEEKSIQADCKMLSKFKNVPEHLKKQSSASGALLARMEMRSKVRGASSGK